MTFTEEFNTQTEEFDTGGGYPTAFGITFTPQVTGIALGVLGLVGAGYVLSTFFLPAWDEFQKIKADETTKQEMVAQQKSGQLGRKLIDAESKLKQAESRKAQVLSLYASPSDLRTFLLDISKFFVARNVKLESFLPQGDPVVVGDDSLGPAVKNKLKRQSFQVTFEGAFGDTHNLIRDLERLQPLILIKNLKTDLTEPNFDVTVVKDNGKATVVSDKNDGLKTSMTLDVLIPLTPEEIAALAPPPPPPGTTPEGQAAPAPGASPAPPPK